MRRMMSMLLMLAAVCACEPALDMPSGGYGGLSVQLAAPSTKAPDAGTGESAVHDAAIFLFDGNGALYRPAMELVEGQTSAEFERIKVGTYFIAAAANYRASAQTSDWKASVRTMDDLRRLPASLDMESPNTGFVMYGEKPVSVTVNADGAAVSVTLELRRLVSRVRLVSVTSGLDPVFGTLTVESVFLENGMSQWSLSGDSEPTRPFNWAGRVAGKNTSQDGPFVDVADADYPHLTFMAPVQEVPYGTTYDCGACFYGYRTVLSGADHFDGPTDGAVKARLVVVASYAGRKWYYPVTIDAMERNKAYDVIMDITGPGSEDPNKPVEAGALSVDVTVKGWDAAADVNSIFS